MTEAKPAPSAAGACEESLPRRLSMLALWLLMINRMIGAGIFGVRAELARLAAGFSPSIFLLGGVLMAPVILCFAQLGGSVRGRDSTSVLAFVVCVGLLTQVSPGAWLAMAALLVVGSGLYLVARRRPVRE